MWSLPGPGLEPVSPALAGGFLTPAPPGKSPICQSLWLLDYIIIFTVSWFLDCEFLLKHGFVFAVPIIDPGTYLFVRWIKKGWGSTGRWIHREGEDRFSFRHVEVPLGSLRRNDYHQTLDIKYLEISNKVWLGYVDLGVFSLNGRDGSLEHEWASPKRIYRRRREECQV